MSTPADFSALSRALFGDLVDADALYEVAKMGPDPSSVHVPGGLTPVRVRRRRRVTKREPKTDQQRERTERQIAQASNVLGLTAGTAAIGATMRDDRLKQGGKTSRAIHRAGENMPKPIERATSRIGPKGAAGLAAGAFGLQVGNVAGDVITARVLGRKSKTKTEVDKGIPLPKLVSGRIASMKSTLGIGSDPILAGGQRAARTRPQQAAAKPFSERMAGAERVASARAARMPAPAATRPPGPAAAAPVTAPARSPLASAAQTSMSGGQARRAQLEEFAGTTGGKVAIGSLGAAGLYGSGKRKGSEQAYGSMGYAKRDVEDVTFGGAFAKFDNDKRQAFGWASVVEVNGEPVIDRQGDYIGIDDIEDAAYVYVRKSRVAGDMHRRTETDEPFKAGELIESVVFTKEKCQAMGLPQACAGKWWIGVQVDDEDTWQEVKKQARTGFSIHGKGIRKDVSYDELVSA